MKINDKIIPKFELCHGNRPVQSSIRVFHEQERGIKNAVETVQITYDTFELSRGMYGKLASRDLTKQLFQVLRACPLVHLSLHLDRMSDRLPLHFVNEGMIIYPMTRHFTNGIGDAMRGHPTLREVELLVDYHEGWNKVIDSLTSCPKLTHATLRFAIHDKPSCPIMWGKSLAKLIAESPATHLVLKHFPVLEEDFARPLFRALSYSPGLKELSISVHDNRVWETSTSRIKDITKALVANRTLEVLDLPMDDAFSGPILEAMESSCTLRRVRLNKEVADSGASLPKDGTIGLCEIAPDETALYVAGSAKPKEMTTVNHFRFDVPDDERIQAAWLKALIDNRVDTKFVHYLLSFNLPFLVEASVGNYSEHTPKVPQASKATPSNVWAPCPATVLAERTGCTEFVLVGNVRTIFG